MAGTIGFRDLLPLLAVMYGPLLTHAVSVRNSPAKLQCIVNGQTVTSPDITSFTYTTAQPAGVPASALCYGRSVGLTTGSASAGGWFVSCIPDSVDYFNCCYDTAYYFYTPAGRTEPTSIRCPVSNN